MLNYLFDQLTRFADSFKSLPQEQKKENALRSISHALNETCLYYRDGENGYLPDRDREKMLVKYWSAAAIAIQRYDPDLAVTCDLKSEFWVNPDNFNYDDIESLGIGLNTVRETYWRLLNPRGHNKLRNVRRRQ
ncbi:hypothetical protein DN068_20730 [Taibaiella soli]|uniref:Uncharacterized protein n=1 Tax=Taibaiella soli TaxID=1649169 RepID=A0A2W2A737_9BACT|nr:hypothetical protein DN068_20730 [Taibaiella soli]